MKRFIFITFVLFAPSLALALPPQAEQLAQRLTELLPRDARWGVTVLDIESGREIVSAGDTTSPLSPASLVKLFTSGAALEKEAEGKPAALATEILCDGKLEDGSLNGNIYLRGNGNCMLSANDLRNAAQALRRQGVKKIDGRVVADATRFDARGLERFRKGAGYAPVSALGMDMHTVSVNVAPAEPGKAPKVVVEPANPQARFAVAARGTSGDSASLYVSRIGDSVYKIGGRLPAGSGTRHWRFELIDPALYAAQSFRGILGDADIRVSGNAGKGRAPDDAEVLVIIPGPALKEFVREMNLNSLNVAADNLLLALVSSPDGLAGTREKGLALLREHLERHGVSPGEATVADGSGLLPATAIAPRSVARYLLSAARQPWFRALYNSLARAGVDGTLRSGAFKSKLFRAKSGNLENVTALAGYGVDKAGREIVFAFIANSSRPLPPNARGAGDALMRFLGEWSQSRDPGRK